MKRFALLALLVIVLFSVAQRNTPQNKSCDSCHGNAALFINEKDLRPYEIEANKGVIPATLPPKMGQ